MGRRGIAAEGSQQCTAGTSQLSACTEIGPFLTTVGGTQMSLIGTWQTQCLRPSVGLASSVDERPLIDPGSEGEARCLIRVDGVEPQPGACMEDGDNDRLILDRVDGTGGIDHPPARLERPSARTEDETWSRCILRPSSGAHFFQTDQFFAWLLFLHKAHRDEDGAGPISGDPGK